MTYYRKYLLNANIFVRYTGFKNIITSIRHLFQVHLEIQKLLDTITLIRVNVKRVTYIELQILVKPSAVAAR